jgi:tRNA nucleotidyltransferase/poly(A) polymerase
MPTPFEDVFDEKTWTKERDKTGLKSGLTEKVSMGDEFKKFQQKKDQQAALHLLEKIGIYEQVLKNTHAKEKYYANLLRLLESQKKAVKDGIEMIQNAEKTKDKAKEDEKELVKRPPKTKTIKTQGNVSNLYKAYAAGFKSCGIPELDGGGRQYTESTEGTVELTTTTRYRLEKDIAQLVVQVLLTFTAGNDPPRTLENFECDTTEAEKIVGKGWAVKP